MRKLRNLLIIALAACLLLAACSGGDTPAPVQTDPTEETRTPKDQGQVTILFTGNVQNVFEKEEYSGQIGYAALAAYRDELEDAGHQVILVDGGNAMALEAAGTVREGRTLAELIGSVGYHVRVVGERELTYGVADFESLTQKMKESEFLSCNLVDAEGQPVFAAYAVLECGDMKVGFVGITTPHAADTLGDEAYGFCQGSTKEEFYSAVQDAIDAASRAGADYVIAVGDLGTDPTDSPWTCAEVIANSTGLTAFLDAGGSVLKGQTVTDLDHYEIPVCGTGSEFNYVGRITLDLNDGSVKVELVTELEDENSTVAKAAADLAEELIEEPTEAPAEEPTGEATEEPTEEVAE